MPPPVKGVLFLELMFIILINYIQIQRIFTYKMLYIFIKNKLFYKLKRLFSTFSNIFRYILQFIYIVGIRLINILKEFCDQKIKEISNNSSYFLEKAAPILIDEWQQIPEIWDLIRLDVDKRDKMGNLF